MRLIQSLLKTGALGDDTKTKAAANHDLDKSPIVCGSCAYGKAKRRAMRSKRDKASDNKEKVLSKDVLIPGQKVSMDHFVVTTPGRQFNSRGRDSIDKMFKGGVIFVDHASGYVFVEPVINFTAGEALRAKRAFEADMESMGVTVLNYHTDNGVFTAATYQDEIAKTTQGMTLSGVGAHHQNAVAERAIGTVMGIARTMMLHAKMCWPKEVTTKLWPMAVKHAQFLVNHIPNNNNVCPLDVILKTIVPRQALKNLHVWGAPTYMLDPRLQDGHKIPKFEPRSRKGLNLGWSPRHASTVPLVLNLQTGSVSPQFHVVIDDWFTTVSSDGDDPDEPLDGNVWTTLLMDHRVEVYFDERTELELDDEWLTEAQRLERHAKAMARVQSNRGIPPTILDETSMADKSKTPLQQQPPLELATTQHETTAAPTSPQIRQQREHHVTKEPQPSAESAYLERDQ